MRFGSKQPDIKLTGEKLFAESKRIGFDEIGSVMLSCYDVFSSPLLKKSGYDGRIVLEAQPAGNALGAAKKNLDCAKGLFA